jgi:hypothetical protein
MDINQFRVVNGITVIQLDRIILMDTSTRIKSGTKQVNVLKDVVPVIMKQGLVVASRIKNRKQKRKCFGWYWIGELCKGRKQ